MELMEAIRGRRSVRAFAATPLDRAVVEQLLDAAVQAPTGMNCQPWAFGVVQGVEAVAELGQRAKAHLLAGLDDASPLARYRERLSQPDFHLFYGAPAVVVIYGKPDGVTTAADTAMAAQNLMLAAYGLGLGTCWIGFAHGYLEQPEVKAEMGVPAAYKVAAPLAVGHPVEAAPPVDKRPPEIVYWR